MTKRTRLIALIDFSLYAHAIAELGNRWCKIADADLLLLHKVPGIVPGMADGETRLEIIKSEKEEALLKLMKLAEGKFPEDINVKFHVTDRNLLLEISDLMKQGFNDYVILGIKGTGMLKKILMGSTATKIINELNAITVAVPDKLCTASSKLCNLVPKHIVVTINDRYALNEPAFNNFLDTFRGSIGQIQFMSVIHTEDAAAEIESYLKTLQERYNGKVPSSYSIFKGTNVFNEVRKNVQINSDTILVVQKGSRSLTDQLFRKFLINQLVHDGSLPLVIMPS
ncbi:universal stress protein [Agriterribacter sp.]|uniref:universal stress protein n=1 Tax=Agriterribacter sp. TaxID=2821509 RepID=UPI002BAB464D|nr:universal stress protein [Agriterribacter sp.]HRO47003.1 universal stress protein [Agriterribacter sp.]HRQ17845.1 universal stress protein [Agriterribacter sp.]